ncbi:MAG: ADP-ribosylglycohydrolase family protein, partial [Leptolyngbyaceae cyanobacterium CSU_1_3]|nr:ADP-ribosylglycohydrolase family protein [Leptolyngbyaceae cyanobacterium CSU_1_3]
NESCQGTVPEAIIAFLESTDFEDAIRNAVSLGGDTDTLACITGGIAEAFYGGVPDAIASTAMGYLDPHLREMTMKFLAEYRNLSAK